MRWFKHEARAHSDAKIEKLLVRYGIQGYGLYFYCLELIVETVEPNNVTFQLEHDAEIISRRINVHPDQVQEMMKYMIDLGLFESNHGCICCNKILKRLDTSMTSNPELRKIIKNYHDPVMTQSTNSHDSVRADKIRLDKIRLDKSETDVSPDNLKNPTLPKTKKGFIRPSIEEIKQYCNSRHNDIDPEQFHDFYESKGWMVGKNPMKDWQATVRTWERQQKHKTLHHNNALLDTAI